MTLQDGRLRAETLQARFGEIFGEAADGVWAAPGRVNLIGEHTDYNDGFVLPFALPQSTQVAGRARGDATVCVHSLFTGETVEFALAELRPGGVDGWAAYVAGICWALQAADVALTGADLLIDSDVPHGAGLSSSAALECSVGLAVVELSGVGLEPLEMARIAQRAENEFVGMPCGLMDQMISMLGRAGHAVLFDTRSLTPSPVPLAPEGDAEVLVIDTRAPHRLVDGAYAARRRQCEQAADALGVGSLRELSDTTVEVEELLAPLSEETLRRRARHVITENRRVLETVELLRVGDLAAVGERMTASHVSLRDDYEVTVEEIDRAFEAVCGAGVLGARITGGGFGGCVIALAPVGVHDQVAAAVADAFAEAGFTAPTVFRAPPSDGARRVL
ncbi:galactokinase [Nesterenkonia suensis]